jgi:hypothetical protein
MHETIDGRPAHSSSRALTQRPKAKRPLNLREAASQRKIGKFVISAGVLGFPLVVLVVILLMAREQNLVQRLQQVGVRVEAEVVSRTDVGHGTYRLTYRFTAPQGAAKSFVGTEIVDRIGEGSGMTGQVTIVYDPADPRRSRLLSALRPPADPLSYAGAFCWCWWPLPLSGLLMLRVAGRRYDAARQLEQAGQLAQGIVVDRWWQRGREAGNAVAYQFDAPLPDGSSRQVVKGELVDLVTRYTRLQIGTPVQVRYLPTDPNVCRIEERL